MKKFRKNEKRKQLTVVTIVTTMLLVLIAGLSYAVYQREEDVLFINATVGKFKGNDIELAIKLDGEQVDTPPTKDNYTVTVDCDNATGRWDTNEWAAVIGNISANKVKCEVNFVTPKPTLSEVTADSDKTSISLSYTAGGIGTSTTCEYGTEEGNYINSVEEVQNTNCNISGLEMDTLYYYQICAKNGGGELCKTGSVRTKPNTQPISVLKRGDYVYLVPDKPNWAIPYYWSYDSNTKLPPSELSLWRVINKNSDGTVDVVSVYIPSVEIKYYGESTYKNLVSDLKMAVSGYENDRYVEGSRPLGLDTQVASCEKISNCTDGTEHEKDLNLVKSALGTLTATTTEGTKRSYILPTRKKGTYYDWSGSGGNIPAYYVYTVNSSGEVVDSLMIWNTKGSYSSTNVSFRPVLTLKSSVEIISGNGKSAETAYRFE